MNFRIRAANIDDLKSIQMLNLLLFKKEDTECGIRANLEWTFSERGTNYFKKTIEEDDGLALVAEIDGKIVGYLAAWIQGKHPCFLIDKKAELDNMFVLEEYRNMGIGSALVKEFKEWCVKREVEIIKVGVFAQNAMGRNFYMKNGFEEYELIMQIKI